ncbi:hypothetical protein [Methyloglobulus sp.]|uniref:hypothetical protein n=1 Tax=Methyloglobulus sp. TaxID=2518622 RepID=UPI0032B8578C
MAQITSDSHRLSILSSEDIEDLYGLPRFTDDDVVTLNRTHSLKYLKEGVCKNESRKTESLYG